MEARPPRPLRQDQMGRRGRAGPGGPSGPKNAPDVKEPFITRDCAIAAIDFGLNLGIDVVGGKSAVSAMRLMGAAGVAFAESWSPSIIRELGQTFGYVEQRRLVAKAGGLMIEANPELFGVTGHFSNAVRENMNSGGFDPLTFIPGYGTVKAAREAWDACGQ